MKTQRKAQKRRKQTLAQKQYFIEAPKNLMVAADELTAAHGRIYIA